MSRAIPAYLPLAAGFVFAATWMMTPAPRQSVSAARAEESSVAFPEARGKPAPIPESWRAEKPEDLTPGPPPPAAPRASGRRALAAESSVYYRGCREARAAGVAPLYRGQPGSRSGMDGDNDGIACEPYHP
jgi:Excalibur calcium-binding domain